MTRILNQTTMQKSDIVEKRRRTSLVVTLPKFPLKPFAFSNACKSYLFFCSASRHLWESHSHLVIKMQTLHGHSKQSGLGPITFLQTKVRQTCNIVACSKTKIDNFSTFQKHCVVAANFLPKLQTFIWQMSSTILSANVDIVPLLSKLQSHYSLAILVSNHIWPMHLHLSMSPTKSLQ